LSDKGTWGGQKKGGGTKRQRKNPSIITKVPKRFKFE